MDSSSSALLLRFLRDDYVADLQQALAQHPTAYPVVVQAIQTIDQTDLYALDVPRDLYRPLVQLQTLDALATAAGDASVWGHVVLVLSLQPARGPQPPVAGAQVNGFAQS